MADEEVATRGPESDAQEDKSVFPGDSTVDQGASMGVRSRNLFRCYEEYSLTAVIGTLRNG